MKNKSSYKKYFYICACILLCAAIVLSLLLPAADLIRAQLLDPLGDGELKDVDIWQVGDQIGEMEDIVIPNGGSVKPTQPEETIPETKPPEETQPDEPGPTQPDQGNEDEGNNNGNQGEEGGEDSRLDVMAVLTWYKYGTQPNTIACGAGETVAKSINTAQLNENTLKYAFTLTGKNAAQVRITSITVAAGDSSAHKVDSSGNLHIETPDGGSRNYTFQVHGQLVGEETGEETEIAFTFVLKCAYSLDLDLELTWRPKDGNVKKIVCVADKTEIFSVKNSELHERVFSFSLELAGSLAENARIVSGSYTTASGQSAGDLAIDKGTLILDPAPGQDKETYYLTFIVKTSQREVTYTYELRYQETLDVQLQFQWTEKGGTQRIVNCTTGNVPTLRIKTNMLSAGAIGYSMVLAGADGAEGRILGAAYVADSGRSGNLKANGSLPLDIAEGSSSNTYHVTVTAMVKGQRVDFAITIQVYTDVSLKMQYSVQENGIWVTRQILCENTRTKTAEAVYDDQLTGGMLDFTMELMGSEESLTIVSVTCYQHGSGKTVNLGAQGQIKLLMK